MLGFMWAGERRSSDGEGRSVGPYPQLCFREEHGKCQFCYLVRRLEQILPDHKPFECRPPNLIGFRCMWPKLWLSMDVRNACRLPGARRCLWDRARNMWCPTHRRCRRSAASPPVWQWWTLPSGATMRAGEVQSTSTMLHRSACVRAVPNLSAPLAVSSTTPPQ